MYVAFSGAKLTKARKGSEEASVIQQYALIILPGIMHLLKHHF